MGRETLQARQTETIAEFYEHILSFSRLLSGDSSVNVTVTFSTARWEVVLAITSLDTMTVEKQTIPLLNKETFLKADATMTRFHNSRPENFSIDTLKKLILDAVDEKSFSFPPSAVTLGELGTEIFPQSHSYAVGSAQIFSSSSRVEIILQFTYEDKKTARIFTFPNERNFTRALQALEKLVELPSALLTMEKIQSAITRELSAKIDTHVAVTLATNITSDKNQLTAVKDSAEKFSDPVTLYQLALLILALGKLPAKELELFKLLKDGKAIDAFTISGQPREAAELEFLTAQMKRFFDMHSVQILELVEDILSSENSFFNELGIIISFIDRLEKENQQKQLQIYIEELQSLGIPVSFLQKSVNLGGAKENKVYAVLPPDEVLLVADKIIAIPSGEKSDNSVHYFEMINVSQMTAWDLEMALAEAQKFNIFSNIRKLNSFCQRYGLKYIGPSSLNEMVDFRI